MPWQVTDAAGKVHTYHRQPENERAVYVDDYATFIYALVDPDTRSIRYVGKSVRPVERASNHYNEPPSNCHRSHWIASLRRRGVRPTLIVLDVVAGDWRAAERAWIAYCRDLGLPLTNNTDGGDGVGGLPLETRERMRRTWLGRKHRPESIERLRAARALRVTTPETRLKMSRSQSGRKIAWIDKIAEAVRAFTAEEVVDIKTRLDAGARVCDLAAEFGVHRTTISKIKMGAYYRQAVANLGASINADAGLFA